MTMHDTNTTPHRTWRRLMAGGGLALMLLAGLAAPAAAKDWQHNGSRTGPKGSTVTTHGSGSCSGGGCSTQSTTTGPNGNSWGKSGAIQATGNGGWTTSRTLTGPNGQSATVSGTGSCSGGSCSKTLTGTAPNGQTWTKESSTQMTGNGATGTGGLTHSSSWTGANGQSAASSTTVQKTGTGGWTVEGTTTGPKGNVWTTTGSGSCADGSCSSQSTSTGPNGGAITRSNNWVTVQP